MQRGRRRRFRMPRRIQSARPAARRSGNPPAHHAARQSGHNRPCPLRFAAKQKGRPQAALFRFICPLFPHRRTQGRLRLECLPFLLWITSQTTSATTASPEMTRLQSSGRTDADRRSASSAQSRRASMPTEHPSAAYKPFSSRHNTSFQILTIRDLRPALPRRGRRIPCR